MPAGTPTGYWLLQSHFHFRKSPLQGLYLLINFHPQVLDGLHHFHKPHACFLGHHSGVYSLQLCLCNLIEPFLWVFFKPLDSLRRFMIVLFKFCVLRFTYVFSLANISTGFVGLERRYWLDSSYRLYFCNEI